jgi:hypothetical protein
LADRYLSDAQQNISLDGKFLSAYHAALNLCSVLLYAQGYRPNREREHYRTIQAVPLILGSDRAQDAKYLDDCRLKRNLAQYESAGVVSKNEAGDLISFVKTLRSDVLDWLRLHHPELLKEETV